MADTKPRHAVALALMGWYLMVPPPWRSPGTYPIAGDMKAPLRQWTIISTFPNEKECLTKGGDALANYRFKKEGMLLAPMGILPQMLDLRWSGDKFECVATDDPRLKEK
jgi:hypothetical protein